MIKYLLFDLDNTLYSCNYGLEDNVSRRIRDFAAEYLGISPEEAWKMRVANMSRYGTCLEWLMEEEGFTDAEAYFAAIHPEGEADSLPQDDELRAFLAGIPIPKAILTNSPREHADLVLGKLGIGDLFTDIFDIRICSFVGKPRPEVFNHVAERLGLPARDILFIDDNPCHVDGFTALGGAGLLIDENNIYQNYRGRKIGNIKELCQFI